MGKWQEYVKKNPPEGASKARKYEVRQDAKDRYKVQKGDSCFVCDDDRIEILKKHHLLPVSLYANRPDINNHLLCLCENCHSFTHMLVLEDRKGISWNTVMRLKESGHWQKYIEIDRMTVEAARGIVSEYAMRGRG